VFQFRWIPFLFQFRWIPFLFQFRWIPFLFQFRWIPFLFQFRLSLCLWIPEQSRRNLYRWTPQLVDAAPGTVVDPSRLLP
jgi:hypothetical protein